MPVAHFLAFMLSKRLPSVGHPVCVLWSYDPDRMLYPAAHVMAEYIAFLTAQGNCSSHGESQMKGDPGQPSRRSALPFRS